MSVRFLQVIREVQIPLVAVVLLVASLTKARSLRRSGPVVSHFGPTALFPVTMRKPVAVAVCIAEAVLGLGLIVTARGTAATGGFATATGARLGAGLLFLVATSTLIELRTVRPDVGCGCFGDFSTAPVSGRTITRSALLAAAVLSTIGLRALKAPDTGLAGLELLAIVCVELALIASLSPEIGAGLIRLGYSEPCELKHVPSGRTLTALRHSKQWRRYGRMVTSDVPVDIWRELCWRYVVYPTSYEGRRADLVFAVFLQYRRPVVQAALVDSLSGLPLPLPTKGRVRSPEPAPAAGAAAGAVDAGRSVGAAEALAPDGTPAAGSTPAAGGAPAAGGGAPAGGALAAVAAGSAATADAASAAAASPAGISAAAESVATTVVDLLPRQPNGSADAVDLP